ncbi:MAG: TRAP transporter small permease subunit [Rhodobacteraceae bacterium]|nr:TRAP transporter small permease subunit [Paracoccaceae bacterium]
MTRAMAGLIQVLRNINRAIESVLNPVAMVLMVMMLFSVVWGVFTRLAGISAPWTDKMMLILLPTLAFVVAPIAYRRSANVALDLLRDTLPPRARNLHGLAMHLAILVMLLIGLDLTLRKVGIDPAPLSALIEGMTGLDLSVVRPFAPPIRIPVLNIEWRYVYQVMPACITLMILGNFELILRHVLAIFDPDLSLARPVRSLEESESKLWD